MLTFSFFTTPGCHLCEQALSIVHEVHSANPQIDTVAKLLEVDIAEDDGLIDVYGTRIPVIRCEFTNDELGWPFDHQAYIDFLNAQLQKRFSCSP